MYLFSYKIKYLGILFILLSAFFAYLYFWGGKPDVFNIKVFALVSVYLETRYFVLSQTNILDELAVIFLIAGVTLINFSKEKHEKEFYNNLRVKALVKAIFLTLLIWILSILLIYGMAIFLVSSFIFLVYLICFYACFRFELYKEKSKKDPLLIMKK